MELIDKAAIVAEIEKRIKEVDEIGTYLSPKGILTNLLCRLDTIEAKDVNMEKTVIGEYDCDDDSSWISFDGWMLNYSFVGKKVRVIIVDESMEDKE